MSSSYQQKLPKLNSISADVAQVVQYHTEKILAKVCKEYNLDINEIYDKFLSDKVFHNIKKKRKKTILKNEEQCLARKQDGLRCTRRRKRDNKTGKILDFCGKHLNNSSFGRVDDINLENNFFKTHDNDPTIKVMEICINGQQFFIDCNDILYNKEQNLIIGKYNRKKNKIILLKE